MIETIRTIIADDEPLARRQLRALLRRDAQIELVGEATNGREARRALLRHQPELALLDVRMPLGDGFSVLEDLPRRPYVIFATAHAGHAVHAFDVEAVDYLLKPFDDERFERALSRAKHAIRATRLMSAVHELAAIGVPSREAPTAFETARLAVHDGRGVIWVEARDIEWIEAADYYAQVHSEGKPYLVREPLQKLEERLGHGFLRVHRGALVNVEKIRRLEREEGGEVTVILCSGLRVQVSRARRAAVWRAIEAAKSRDPPSSNIGAAKE
jgi:two-component system, LytTR family, response regulator